MSAGGRRALRVGIVADDFTSAMDGAAPFAQAGRSVSIVPYPVRDALPEAGVVAVDCDSRRRPAAEAAERAARAAGALAGLDVLFKTVDSTLRGHVADELAAAYRVAGRALVVVAPAFPAAGRVTRAGVQLVDGRPVHESAFGGDARHPARESDLRRLLEEVMPAPPVLVEPGAGVPAEGLAVADAAGEDELQRLVAGVPDPARALWVGSPGLARALAAGLPAPPPRPAAQAPRGSRLLVVVGTQHAVARRQVAAVLSALGSRAAAVVETEGAVPPGCELAVLSAPPRSGSGPVPDAAAAGVAERLARRAAALICDDGFDACLATGGETAEAVVRALGAERVELLGEPEPGIALGRVHGPAPCLLATKAGGFGDSDTLVRLHRGLVG